MVFMLGLTVGGPVVYLSKYNDFFVEIFVVVLKKIPWYIYGFLKINPSFLVTISANYKLSYFFYKT